MHVHYFGWLKLAQGIEHEIIWGIRLAAEKSTRGRLAQVINAVKLVIPGKADCMTYRI